MKKRLASNHGETDMSGINPIQNQMQRSQTLTLRRHGSTGNGSLNPRDHVQVGNHVNPGAPKYSTLPRKMTSSTVDAELESQISPSHSASQHATPLIGNHISPASRPTTVGWAATPTSHEPMMFTPDQSSVSMSPRPLPNGRPPPLQRAGVMGRGESIDRVQEERERFGLGNDYEYERQSRIDRRSEERYSVERSSAVGSHVSGGSQGYGAPVARRDAQGSTGSLSRRKTLPSIMHPPKTITIDPNANTSGVSRMRAAKNQAAPVVKTTRDDIMDTYVIENGVRKRIQTEIVTYPRPPSPSPSQTSVTSLEAIDDKPKQLPKVYKLEPASLSASKKRGSLPDVSRAGDVSIMPRTEATKLSQARRDELRMLREQEEARRRMELVLRFGDVKVNEECNTVLEW